MYREKDPEYGPESGPHTRIGLAATRLRLAHRSFWKYRSEEFDSASSWIARHPRALWAIVILLILPAIASMAKCVSQALENRDRDSELECEDKCIAMGAVDSFKEKSACFCIPDGGGAMGWRDFGKAKAEACRNLSD